MVKIATVFSGIGAAEQALKQMGIEHEIVFACDNGERYTEIDKDIVFEKALEDIVEEQLGELENIDIDTIDELSYEEFKEKLKGLN